MNNVEVSCEYLLRVQAETEADAVRSFSNILGGNDQNGGSGALAKIRTNLSVFSDSAAALQQLLVV